MSVTTKKIRERRKNSDGDYDIIHRETEAGLVITSSDLRFVSDTEMNGIDLDIASLNTKVEDVIVNTYTKNEIDIQIDNIDVKEAPTNDVLYGRKNSKWFPIDIKTSSLYATIGVKIDLSNSDPTACVTYIDESGTQISTPTDGITNLIKDIVLVNKPTLDISGMNINSDVTINDIIIADNGSQNSTTIGIDTFVRIPKMGIKIDSTNPSAANNIITMWVTNNPNKSGFSYNSHSRITENDRDYLYIGTHLGFNSGSQLYSYTGITPTPSVSLTNWRTYAQARGSSGTGANRWGYDQISWYPLILLQCLYVIIFKSLDSQTVLGRGYVDGNSASVITGGTNGKSGCRTIPNVTGRDGLFYGESTGKSQMKFLGIEDFYGNMYYWIEGISSNANRQIVTSYSGFTSTAGAPTSPKGTFGITQTANSGGYIRNVIGNIDGGFCVQTQTYGSASTYFADRGALYASCFPRFGGC